MSCAEQWRVAEIEQAVAEREHHHDRRGESVARFAASEKHRERHEHEESDAEQSSARKTAARAARHLECTCGR